MSMSDLELLRAACCVAGTDGSVSDRERRFIQRLAEKAGVGAASLKAMIEMAEVDQDFHRDQFGTLKQNPHGAIRRLYVVAAADGSVGEEELGVLQHFGRRLGLTDQQTNEEMEDAKADIIAARGRGSSE